ncbi:MAG TPA: OmpA family protein [Myxococcales bacterium]
MRLSLVSALFLATALAAAPARAGIPEREVYVGAALGGTATLRAWDLGQRATFRTLEPRGTAQVGLRVGFQILEQFGFEVGAQFLPLPVNTGGITPAFVYHGDVLVNLLKGDITPFLVGGAGGYNSFGGPLGGDLDFQFHLGAGMRFVLKDWLVLRAEIRDVVTDGFGKANTVDGNNLEITVGIDLFPLTALGNKDRDGDGIPNDADKCPDEPGDKATLGCPDKDKDLIADRDDQCPDVPGVPMLKGCPDKDGDGVSDPEDKCPDEPGPRMLKGCPDRDGDGVADGDDECPDVPGSRVLKGCPDRDADGVADKDDKCPDQRGLKEFAGCLPEEAERFTGAIQGIRFELDRAEILPSSFPVLDQAVAVLQKYKGMRIQIEGHTDNTGEAAHNQRLSTDRAEAVQKYLLDRDIAADRLKAVGFGQDRPIASNETEKGRASNRRVEFNLIAQ